MDWGKAWSLKNCQHSGRYCHQLPTILQCQHVQTTQGPGSVFTTLYFFSWLTNGRVKLECYITLGWKGLPETNTLAFWNRWLFTKMIKCCEYGTWAIGLTIAWKLGCSIKKPKFCQDSLAGYKLIIQKTNLEPPI